MERSDDDAIEAMLDRMFLAIRHGDLTQVPELTDAVGNAIAALQGETDAARLRRIQTKAARNTLCLAAAGRGLRAARRRLEAVATAQNGMQTYDGDGQSQTISNASTALRQRL